MNLVPKLSVTFIVGLTLVLSVNGFFRVRREVGLFETDRIRDDVQVGKTLAAAVTTVWQTDGEERAMSLVRHADAQEGRLRVRWVWQGGDSSVSEAHRAAIGGTPPLVRTPSSRPEARTVIGDTPSFRSPCQRDRPAPSRSPSRWRRSARTSAGRSSIRSRPQ